MNKFLLLLVFFSSQAFSQVAILKSDEDFSQYDYYYHIKVPRNEPVPSIENISLPIGDDDADPSGNTINLMSFEKINEKFPMPASPYNRDVHYGGWLVDQRNGNCKNTRALVLIRDSSTKANLDSTGCFVANGDWNDPYTARLHKNPKDIQIDHVVPLKNSYMTGGHEWSFARRCLYANYMGNNFHLLSVNGPENLKKSDHTPQGYIPPNKNYTCTFLKIWLNIKLIWDLRITPQEGDSIKKISRDNNCSPETFKVSREDYNKQLQFIQDNADLCQNAGSSLMSFNQ